MQVKYSLIGAAPDKFCTTSLPTIFVYSHAFVYTCELFTHVRSRLNVTSDLLAMGELKQMSASVEIPDCYRHLKRWASSYVLLSSFNDYNVPYDYNMHVEGLFSANLCLVILIRSE